MVQGWFRLDSDWIPKNERGGRYLGVSLFESLLDFKQMGVSKNDGTQQPWVFLLKMIILGVFWGYHHFGKLPNCLLQTLTFGLWDPEDWDEPLDTAKASSKQITANP